MTQDGPPGVFGAAFVHRRFLMKFEFAAHGPAQRRAHAFFGAALRRTPPPDRRARLP